MHWELSENSNNTTGKAILSSGFNIVIAKTEFGNCGLMICWDMAFPEIARELAIQGADMIVVPSAWECPYSDEFALFAQARAIDNTVFVAVCNHVGKANNLTFFGQSSVYGPNGKALGRADGREQVITVEMNLLKRKIYQNAFFTMLHELRPEVYKKGASYYESGKNH